MEDVKNNIKQIENFIKELDIFSESVATHSLLSSIGKKYDMVGKDIEDIEQVANNLEASLQVISEEADYLGGFSSTTANMVGVGISTIRDILEILAEMDKRMADVLRGIVPFRDKFQEIDRIAEKIFEIARLTENAARNTGIKAYHAGDSGRGFEVIAEEMASLARNAYKSTSVIPTIINEIKNKVALLSDNISQIGGKVEELKSLDREIEKTLSLIDQNMRRQIEISSRIKEVISKQKENRLKLQDINVKLRKMIDDSINMGERIKLILLIQESIKKMYDKYEDDFYEMLKYDDIAESEWMESTIDRIIKTIKVSISINDQISHIGFELKNIISSQRAKLKDFHSRLDDIEIENKNIQEYSIEMEESIISLKRLLENAVSKMKKGAELLTEMQEGMQEVISIVKDIRSNIDNIDNSAKNIHDIAKRSRLLSLYASIEAARSGEYRESLSVIVNQTNSLVDESTSSISLVGRLSSEMKEGVNYIEGLLNQVVNGVNEGVGKLAESINATEELYDSASQLISLANEVEDNISKQESIISNMIDLQKKIDTTMSDMDWESSEIEKLVEKQKNDALRSSDKLLELKNLVPWKEMKSVEYRSYVSSTVSHLDPHYSTNVATSSITTIMHKGLVVFDVDGNIVPGIVAKWDILGDGKIWRFYLREDVYFHNGKRITPQDIAYSFKRILKSPNAKFIDMIKGAEDYIKGKKNDVEGIRIINAYSFEIELEYPYFLFITNLAVSSMDIVPYGSDPDRDKIGCGPYMWVKETEEGYYFERFDNYMWGKPYCKRLFIGKEIESTSSEIFEKFKRGEYHAYNATIGMLEEIEKNPIYRNSILSVPYFVTHYLGINSNNNPLLKIKQIRQAIHYAIDKEEMVKELYNGKYPIATTILPPGFPGYRKGYEKYTYDPTKAKELIKRTSIDVSSIPIKLFSSSGGKRVELIKSYLGEIGLKVEEVTFKTWSDFVNAVYNGKAELFLLAWAADLPEPENFFYPLFHSHSKGNKGNGFHYSNPEVDELILRARKIRNREERIMLYHKIEDIILDDAPIIPLNHTYKYIIYQPSVHNQTISPMNVIPHEDFWITEENNG